MNTTERMTRANLVAAAVAAHPGVSGRAWTPDTPRGRVAPVRVYCSHLGRRIGYIVIRSNGELVSSLDALSAELMALGNAAVDGAARATSSTSARTVSLGEALAPASDGEIAWTPPTGRAPAELLDPVSKASGLASGARYRLVGGPHAGKVGVARYGVAGAMALALDDGTIVTVADRTARAGAAEWVFGACAA